MPSKLFFVLFLLSLLSCTAETKLPLIVFSHNINGELEPCGCRKTPLGGMEQAISFMRKLKKENPKREILYFDTGDSFFPLGRIPKMLHAPYLFAAEELGKLFKDLNLTAQLPGDQEFSFGASKYAELLKKENLPSPLITNFKKNSLKEIKPQKSLTLIYGNQVLYVLGVLHPQSFPTWPGFLISPQKALKAELEKLHQEHTKKHKGKKKIFLLLSHSGMEEDKKLAKAFPELRWIIGAHTQSFTQLPVVEGKTSITQVLSRNHFIGLIDLESTNPKKIYRAIELNETFQKGQTDQKLKKRVKEYHEKREALKKDAFKVIGEDE